MRKRRTAIDKAIELLEDEIRVRNAAIGALLVQRGDDVVPPRATTRGRPKGAARPVVGHRDDDKETTP